MPYTRICKIIFLIFFFTPLGAQDTLTIFFEHDKHNIPDSIKPGIAKMADLLLNSSHKILYIHGYTDHTGSIAYNKWLSYKRALQVKKELISLGVPPNLIESIEGKGELPNPRQNKQRIPQHRYVDLVCANRSLKKSIQNIDFSKVQAGDEIIIDDLNFQPGRHYLLNESIPRLKKLLAILQKHPNLKIELQGHVCCAPSSEDGMDIDTKTQNLSHNRAKNIYEYLVRNDIDSTRLSYKGFGRSKPLYPKERNELERKKNRRVEILVISNDPL